MPLPPLPGMTMPSDSPPPPIDFGFVASPSQFPDDQSTDDMTYVDEEEEEEERSSCPTSQHTLERKRCQRSASPPTPRRAGPIHDYDYYADSNEDVDISAWL